MKIHTNISDLGAIRKCILTVGSFDGLHRGHRELFKKVRSLAGLYNTASVVATFHPHPRQVIYPRDRPVEMITVLDEKIELFRSVGIDHLVIVPFTVEFSQLLPQEYLEKFIIGTFDPSAVVIGYDHRFGLNRSGDVNMMRSYGEEFGFDVIEVDKQSSDEIAISSTKIRDALQTGDIRQANKLLGYRFIISGMVVHGKKKGLLLGFPTANIKIADHSKLVPADGIYAVYVNWGDEILEGMLYIGVRPTLDDGENRSIEVHIFKFDKYIYGEKLVIELVDRIRSDERFENLEELKHALKSDQERVKQRLAEEAEKTRETTAQP